MFAQAVIAGYGETTYHKNDQLGTYDYLGRAIRGALDDAGIPLSAVDGFAATSFTAAADNVTTLANHFGIDGRWFLEGTFGGASPISGLLRGARAIADGRAETIVVVAGDAVTPDSHMDLIDDFNLSIRNGMVPYGFGGANGLFALIQRRHMHEHGTTREQLSNISVTFREHAQRNPNALLQDEMTTEKYLNARPVVEPMHLYDCVLPCGGAGAFVLTSRERADSLDTEDIYVHAADEYHDPNPTEPFELSTGLAECMGVFDQAGVERDDLDAVQVYDDYPIMVAIQLEDLRFCEKGEGGPFVAETDLSIGGELPLNTGGGQLSVGQSGSGGGILGPIEAIRQLRGEGGERQVAGCERVLTTGFGMVAYGGGLSSSVAILGTDDPRGGAHA